VNEEQRRSSVDVRVQLAENIRNRREQVGLTQAKLAERAGFNSLQIVSAIERGEREVKAVELAAIARALHCDLMDLFTEEREETHSPVVAWRERPDDAAVQAARLVQLCEWYALAEEWTSEESSCALQEEHTPRSAPGVLWARALAERVRDKLGLGSLPAASLYQTLEERCGVKIFHFPDLHGSAACARGDFGAGIALNASEPVRRRNFSLAHELFHLITWDDLGPESGGTNSSWSKHVETLANAFASSLLLPESSLRASLEAHREELGITLLGLVEIAREFDVSTEALLWRLVSLGMLKEAQSRQLLATPAFRNLDRMTFAKEQTPEQLPERYLRLLELAYLRGDVSVGRIAEMTEKSVAEVRYKLAQLEEVEGDAQQLVRLA
jgi:XRE family transcriptional regulator, fatty acid utilization regulator